MRSKFMRRRGLKRFPLRTCLWVLALGLGLLEVPRAAATVVSVPGTADPWLAGMPDGSVASFFDAAPAESPVLVASMPLVGGTLLAFHAAGEVGNQPVPNTCCPPAGPDGGDFIAHLTGAENGIAHAVIPINALVGVFLDDSVPSSSAGAPTLDYTVIGTSFASFAPQLRQVFYIGDGLTATGSGAQQRFLVPPGATRLYLGTMDGYEWRNNIGSFTVTVSAIPEPPTWLILLAGLPLGGLARTRTLHRRRRIET